MDSYTLLNYITEDIISRHFKNDYCLLYFPDNIRYKINEKDPWIMLFDKHLTSGDKDGFKENYFYHYNKWIKGCIQDYKLRRNTSNNFIQHSWEPTDINLDKVLWQYTDTLEKEHN